MQNTGEPFGCPCRWVDHNRMLREVGVVLLIPEFLLISVLGTAIVWVEGAVALGLLLATGFLLLSLGKFIKREKLLP